MADSERTCASPRYEQLALPSGWSGIALSGSTISAITGKPIHAPSPIQWRDWLGLLTTNQRRVPGAKALKVSDSVEVLEAALPQNGNGTQPLKVICKQFKSRSVKDLLLRPFRLSSARRGFEKARWLLDAGIGTAQPLAYVEAHSSNTSWLISEFLSGVTDLDAFALTVLPRQGAAANRQARNAVTTSLAQLLARLQATNLYHRDMKASNILLAFPQGEAQEPRLCIVDLDGLSAHRPWKSQWGPLIRLAASLLGYPSITRTEYVRFLRLYLRSNGIDDRRWKSAARILYRQATHYAQSTRRRKADKIDGFTGDPAMG